MAEAFVLRLVPARKPLLARGPSSLRAFFADEWELVSQLWSKLPPKFQESHQTLWFVFVFLFCFFSVLGWGGLGASFSNLPFILERKKCQHTSSSGSPKCLWAGRSLYFSEREPSVIPISLTNGSVVPVSFYSWNVIYLAEDFIFIVPGMVLRWVLCAMDEQSFREKTLFRLWKKNQLLTPTSGNPWGKKETVGQREVLWCFGSCWLPTQ